MDIQNHDSDSCFPKVKHWRENVPYQFHQGFWFNPKHLQATKQVLDHFKPLPNDVILASFPKTGTTWLKSLLYSIVNRASTNQLVTSHPHELVPSLEMQVYGGLVANSPPHFPSNTSSSVSIFSTHIPYQILGKTLNSSDCRVVYVTRNPKDTLISLWHFANSVYLGQKWEPQPLEDIVSKFCKGTVIFGPYFDHVLGYQKESLERPKKFFFITYEELKSDPNIHVKRLAEFLGCPFLGEDMEKQVEEVVRSCSVETLINHEVNKSSDVPSWSMVPYDAYFRKGQVGDHMNYLTKDMIERIDAITKEKFHGINLWGENWMS